MQTKLAALVVMSIVCGLPEAPTGQEEKSTAPK